MCVDIRSSQPLSAGLQKVAPAQSRVQFANSCSPAIRTCSTGLSDCHRVANVLSGRPSVPSRCDRSRHLSSRQLLSGWYQCDAIRCQRIQSGRVLPHRNLLRARSHWCDHGSLALPAWDAVCEFESVPAPTLPRRSAVPTRRDASLSCRPATDAPSRTIVVHARLRARLLPTARRGSPARRLWMVFATRRTSARAVRCVLPRGWRRRSGARTVGSARRKG